MWNDQTEAFAVSDTVIVMKDGDIMQEGSPTDLYKRPASMFMANFMGEANIFPGYFDGETITVNQYRIPADPIMVEGFPNDEYQVGVRPEAILLTDHGDDSQRCTVNKVAYMGNMYEVGVTWHDHDILLQLNTSQFDASLADHAYLSINPTGLFLLPFNA